MTSALDSPTTVADASSAARPGPARPRRRVKRAVISVHRWSALVLGLVLVAITTSGVVVLYEPEWKRWVHSEAYAPSGDRGGIALTGTPSVLRDHDEEFAPQSIYDANGTYVAQNYDDSRTITIDPATSRVLADYDPAEQVNAADWAMGLMHNLHLCLLTCEGEPGYQAWLLTEVPGTSWASLEEGVNLTIGALILGVGALLLGFLALSGIWLWWPGVKRWAHGLRVRWRKGRFARDYDLHQVAGMVAIPFLMMWAITGAGFEFGFVGKGWFQALPGESSEVEFTSVEATKGTPDITLAAAVAAAQRELGTTAPPAGFDLPAADDPTAAYSVWFPDGVDPYSRMEYAGDVSVGVDRTTGATEITYGGPGRPATAQMWEEWNFPTHAGYIVGPWWRLVWVAFGLVPLLLAVTGVSTWLYRRRTRRSRQARKVAASAERSDPVAGARALG
ncbi:MAG: PepSY-associated TM helix domain-containing protein [Dermatophilaceae bacterium]